MVVGITGNYCSGKNLASSLFQDAGYQLIDVDKIGHEALENKKREIVQEFGGDVLLNNRIDRKKLGDIVFSSEEKKRRLETIVHPWMIMEVKRRVQTVEKYVINAAVLIEMCLFVLCDFVLAIDIEQETAINRAVARGGISREGALQILRSQIPVKEKLHFVDKVIDNGGSRGNFEKEVKSIIEDLKSKV